MHHVISRFSDTGFLILLLFISVQDGSRENDQGLADSTLSIPKDSAQFSKGAARNGGTSCHKEEDQEESCNHHGEEIQRPRLTSSSWRRLLRGG